MSDYYCELCSGALDSMKTYIYRLSDDKGDSVEYRCHKKCSDELKAKVSGINGWEKMTVQKILGKLNL